MKAASRSSRPGRTEESMFRKRGKSNGIRGKLKHYDEIHVSSCTLCQNTKLLKVVRFPFTTETVNSASSSCFFPSAAEVPATCFGVALTPIVQALSCLSCILTRSKAEMGNALIVAYPHNSTQLLRFSVPHPPSSSMVPLSFQQILAD